MYNNSSYSNATLDPEGNVSVPSSSMDITTVSTLPIYAAICAGGLIGNGLVVFVITRYTKMKTVTNMYILNLSVADFLFLLGMPLPMTTLVLRHWIFGAALCKIYWILTSINWFTGAFTLTVMSADRFLAVVFPITSMKYRTPKYAIGVIVMVWLLSFLVMLPVVLFAQYRLNPLTEETYTCAVQWPSDDQVTGNKVFILYILFVGFVIPVLLICVFYALLLVRLKTRGPQTRSTERRRSHRKVTKLVSLIIVVYIVCWLPYWSFQIHLSYAGNVYQTAAMKNIFTVLTILTYANSMVNPVLYAFTNENFRESFIDAFKCAKDPIMLGRRGSDNNVNMQNALAANSNNNLMRFHHAAGRVDSNATPAPGPYESRTTEEYEIRLIKTDNCVGKGDMV